MKPILDLAEEKGIAYGAYVTVSYDSALAAIEAGSELNVPVIFITGTDCCDLMGGFAGTVETVKRAAANTLVPIALHLDHCRTYEECVQAINAGYSSVMIDGSSLPFEENIALTKKVVDYAHPLGISVEGELGKLVTTLQKRGDIAGKPGDSLLLPHAGNIAAERLLLVGAGDGKPLTRTQYLSLLNTIADHLHKVKAKDAVLLVDDCDDWS